jgi:hypothetical protein
MCGCKADFYRLGLSPFLREKLVRRLKELEEQMKQKS